MSSKKIALLTAPEGHFSISQAAQEALAEKYEIDVFFDRDISFALYTPIYQYLPVIHQVPYKLAKLGPAKKFIIDIFRQKYDEKITEFINQTKPDLCISSFYMFNPTLEDIQRTQNIPFINLVSDPATIHPLLLSETAASNVLFDQEAKEICQLIQPQGTYDIFGWFVRERFYEKTPKLKARKKLNLNPNLFTILITAGSEGSAMVMKLVPALFTLDRPVQLIVACGSNKQLLNSIKAFNALLKKMPTASTLIPLAFTDQIDQYMHAADLIVGKAGPNTIFESVATQTPFFAITHISGQEDGNLDIIRNYNLGFVEENPLKAIKVLKDIVAQPENLNHIVSDIKKVADKNQKAASKLLNLVKKTI